MVSSLHNFEQLSRAYRQLNCFMDEELYKTVEAYLEAPRTAIQN